MAKTQQRSTSDDRMMEFFNQRARKWGEGYMRRNLWRIQGMYDIDDIKQDVFSVYLRVYRRHPELDEPDLYRIFKRGVQGRVDNRSRQCFPNSFAYVDGQGKFVLELDETLIEEEVSGDIETFLVQWSDVIQNLPKELVEVVRILTRDFLGVECIEQRRQKRLKGKDRVEPLNISIARALGLDPSRDFLNELAVFAERDRVK